MDTHEIFMQRCLDLAVKGIGHVAPNPMVGSVIVHDGIIIGEGYHMQFGQPHAEVNAVRSVPSSLQHLIPQSTLYVNLEPCSHYGKTPPCADMIVQHKIPRVVTGSSDPNPQVAGKGIDRLKTAGVEVITGILKNESDFLNRRFMTYHTKHRPYVILKWAESADGFMAPAEPKQQWLSGKEAKQLVHQWRGEEQAIMVGKRTVEIDDPELTVRLVEGKNPIRLVIDRNLDLPATKKIFSSSGIVHIYNASQKFVDHNIHFDVIDFNQPVLPQVLRSLYTKGVQSIIVEGGPTTLQHFIDQQLWDEARIITAPINLNMGKRSPQISGQLLQQSQAGKDSIKVLLQT